MKEENLDEDGVEFSWETKEGELIKYSEITDSHLLNILRWIEKKAVEGIILVVGGGFCAEDMWGDKYAIKGNDVLKHYDYNLLVNEAKKRKLCTDKY